MKARAKPSGYWTAATQPSWATWPSTARTPTWPTRTRTPGSRAIDRGEEALAGVGTLYVGHGPPAVPAVLADQRRYLLMAREAIARVAGGRAQLTEEEANRVVSLMEPLPAERSAQLARRRRRSGSRRRAHAETAAA